MKLNLSDFVSSVKTGIVSNVQKLKNETVPEIATRLRGYFNDSRVKAEALIPGLADLLSLVAIECVDGNLVVNSEDDPENFKQILDMLVSLPGGPVSLTGTGGTYLTVESYGIDSLQDAIDYWEEDYPDTDPSPSTVINLIGIENRGDDHYSFEKPLVDFSCSGDGEYTFTIHKVEDWYAIVKSSEAGWTPSSVRFNQILAVVKQAATNGNVFQIFDKSCELLSQGKFSTARISSYVRENIGSISGTVLNTYNQMVESFENGGGFGICAFFTNFLQNLSTIQAQPDGGGFAFADNASLMAKDFGAGVITSIISGLASVATMVVAAISPILTGIVAGISAVFGAINNFIMGIPDASQYVVYDEKENANCSAFPDGKVQGTIPYSMVLDSHLRQALVEYGVVALDFMGGKLFIGFSDDPEYVNFELHLSYNLSTVDALYDLIQPEATYYNNTRVAVGKNPSVIGYEALWNAYNTDLQNSTPFDPTNTDSTPGNNIGLNKSKDLQKRYSCSEAYALIGLLAIALEGNTFPYILGLWSPDYPVYNNDYRGYNIFYEALLEVFIAHKQTHDPSFALSSWNDFIGEFFANCFSGDLSTAADLTIWDNSLGEGFGRPNYQIDATQYSELHELIVALEPDHSSFYYIDQWMSRLVHPLEGSNHVTPIQKRIVMLDLFDSISSEQEVFGDIIYPFPYTPIFTIKFPAYNLGSIVTFCIVAAITAAVVAVTAVVVTMKIKKVIAQRRAARAARIEAGWNKCIDAAEEYGTNSQEYKDAYKQYYKDVKRNNLCAKFLGGTTYSKTGFWNEADSSTNTIGDVGGSLSSSYSDAEKLNRIYDALVGTLPEVN